MTRTADASPTKAFFVRMLTRDISLDDCILDLVDNSVDGAWESTGQHPELRADAVLSSFWIDIAISEDSFRITDNCGGITLEDAEQYAFTFGRKEGEPPAEFSVGVYGIGMKRAVFKLGRSIRIISTYEADGTPVGFVVPIEVDEWARENTEWDFNIEDHPPAPQPGVQIEVTNLTEETKQRFGSPDYARDLRRILGRDYLLPLMRGLRIAVNGTPIEGRTLVFQQSEEFVPMRHKYDDDGVTVEILAGMASAPPDDVQPEDPSRTDRNSGWYVLCNGRVVLAADRSLASGWGVGGRPVWHNQYNGFLGVVLFSAAEPAKLPMTTTKRNLDVSSAVYLRALVQMDRPTRVWIDYTNTRKTEKETAERLEQGGSSVRLTDVRDRPNVELPRLTSSSRPRVRVANVNYSVPLSRMRELAEALGGLNYRDVGLRSFDYTYDVFVDGDS
jgi:Histidine kinase-, DNA gyrase B-, and HSP90-like ATPase